jgi:hypothetical protein
MLGLRGSAAGLRWVRERGTGFGLPGTQGMGPRYFYGVEDVIRGAGGFVEHALRRGEDAVLQGVAAGRGLARG